ncbi:hypothetical protein pEaSNUABM29_00022 [Erwinia phage pEa_SNUABM_29]|nr:hypothetical protein pEaSNUABM29_00022 [Erwinia phage pEa_SNUABM_29]
MLTEKETETLALAIEHMKVDQLTKLNAHTDHQRKGYALVAKSAIALNKVLLAKLYSLENGVVHSKGLSDASDKVTDVRMYASREMERLESEWNVQCNGEGTLDDPRRETLKGGVFIKDAPVNEYTGFER